MDVYSLEDGEMHTIKQATKPNFKSRKPVIMGRHRIYLITEDKSCELTACDLKSGEQLYSVALGKDGALLDFAILNIGSSDLEQLIALERRPNASTLQIINGADGKVLQEVKIDLLECPYIAISRSQKEFALVSHGGIAGGDQEIRSQRFSRGRDRVFYSRGVEHFPTRSLLYPPYEELGIQAYDPFGYLVASLSTDRAIPEIRKVDVSVPCGAQTDLPPYLSKCELAKAFRDRIKEELRREITLPPRYAHHKARRPFVPDNRYGPREMRFVDGDRLVYHITNNLGTDVYYGYIFDFGVRMFAKKKGA